MGDSLALYCLPQFHGILARPSRVNVERACSRASLGLGTPPSQIHSFYASRKVSLLQMMLLVSFQHSVWYSTAFLPRWSVIDLSWSFCPADSVTVVYARQLRCISVSTISFCEYIFVNCLLLIAIIITMSSAAGLERVQKHREKY